MKRRFEILVRLVFARFKALLMEPTAFTYAERHDNLEAIYKKLQERRDTSDETQAAADRIYEYVWQRSADGSLFPRDIAA